LFHCGFLSTKKEGGGGEKKEKKGRRKGKKCRDPRPLISSANRPL